MTCITCKHSRPNLDDYADDGEDATPVLECWRYPPLMVPLATDDATYEVVAIRPQVAETDTCGEFQT
jgi:hypothetical protein